MLNKKIWLKAVLFLCPMVGLSLSFASTAWFHVDLQDEVIEAINQEAITKNIMPVHFADNWNDFWWFIYSAGWEDVEAADGVLHIWDHYGVSVGFEGRDWYVCKHRINWFYYNSERWERLFPIDEGTAARWRDLGLQPWLTTSGWLYTECMSAELDDALIECKQWYGADPDDLYDEGQCERNARDSFWFNGYYWMITHEYNWKNFGLIFGAQYSVDDSTWLSVNDMWLGETFIRYENKYPVWLLYDYHGWVWFVGCEFTSDKTNGLRKFVEMLNNWTSLSQMFVETGNRSIEYIGGSGVALNCSGVGIAANSLIQVVVEWLVWIGKESEWGIIWNQTNPKMQFFKSVNVDNATLVNYARKKAETLCRWKWINGENAHEKRWDSYKEHMQFASDFPAGAGNRKELYKSRKSLWNNGIKPSDWMVKHHDLWSSSFKQQDRLFCIDLEKSTEKTIVAEPWYTYIVKWGNVVVTSMDDLSDDTYYYDVYILGGGSLLLDNVSRGYKRVITREGFIEYKHTDVITDPDVIISNYVNAIADAPERIYRGDNVAVGAFIKWNFVVDWQLKHIGKVDEDFSNGGNRISNRYFVYWKLTTKDSVSDLEDLFSWRCPNWISSDEDEVFCPQSASDGSWVNPYENAPLVIIDQNYDSPVFN